MKIQHILSKRSNTILLGLFIGVCAASAGFLGAFLSLNFFFNIVTHQSNTSTSSSNIGLFYIAATLAALLAGPFMWWYFVIKSGQNTMRRGIIVGVMASIVAHPITWLFTGLISYFSGISILGFTINRPGDILSLILLPSIMSLIYVGWLTAFIGGITGALFLFAQRADEHS